LASISDKVAAGVSLESPFDDLDGGTIIADGTEEQYIAALRKARGELPKSNGETGDASS